MTKVRTWAGLDAHIQGPARPRLRGGTGGGTPHLPSRPTNAAVLRNGPFTLRSRLYHQSVPAPGGDGGSGSVALARPAPPGS
jgi:hypothetical protein